MTFIFFSTFYSQERDRPENTDRWGVKRKLTLLLIKLVGKLGFKCGPNRHHNTPAEFGKLIPAVPGPAQTTGELCSFS